MIYLLFTELVANSVWKATSFLLVFLLNKLMKMHQLGTVKILSTILSVGQSTALPLTFLVIVIWCGITYLKVWQPDYKNCRIGMVGLF